MPNHSLQLLCETAVELIFFSVSFTALWDLTVRQLRRPDRLHKSIIIQGIATHGLKNNELWHAIKNVENQQGDKMRNLLLSGVALIALPGSAIANCPAISVADSKGTAPGAYPQISLADLTSGPYVIFSHSSTQLI